MNSSNHRITAIVLAAGLSRRMEGVNKLLLPFQNKAVIRTVVENILSGELDEVIVVVGHEAEKVKSTLVNLPLEFVLNEDYEKGMTTSIQAGVRKATGAGFMICLSDMVLIKPEEYSMMKEAFLQQLIRDPECICIPRYENEKGNPVIFSSAYRKEILNHTEMKGCRTIVQKHQSHVYWIAMATEHVLQDMDFREDYEQLQNETR